MAFEPKQRFHRSTRALKSRNYRLFFSGQAISMIGTWMTRLATSWLVYRLTEDPIMLGVVNFAGLAPTFFLSPICGVLVDRTHDLKRLIFRTQFAAGLQSIGLVIAAAGPFTPKLAVGLLIALNVVQGVINAFDVPARQAFLPRMVGKLEDLPNAIALNSTLFNSARLIGPALAGGMLGFVGETWCFAIDALSYIAVLWAIHTMVVERDEAAAVGRPKFWTGLSEGFSYAWRSPAIRALLSLVAILSFLGMPYAVLLPIYAKEILHGGPHTLGLLTSATGLGAVGAAVVLAGRETTEGITRWIVFAGTIFCVSLFAFAYSTILPLSVFLLLIVGFGTLMQTASCSTILQTIVEPGKRGRVMSLYSVAFLGMSPFGSLAAGFGAARIGAANTLAVSAVLCAASTMYFSRRLPTSTSRV